MRHAPRRNRASKAEIPGAVAQGTGSCSGDVMPHAMAILQGVIAKDGGLICDSKPLRCPRCGAAYDLRFSDETGPSQLQLFRYIASENICNEHPRHHTSIVLGPPRHC